jgi:gamma-glutamyltranspeptidase/glutathione hydrolase
MRQAQLPRLDHEPAPAIAEAAASSALEVNPYPDQHMFFGGVGAACRWGLPGLSGQGTPGGGLEAAGDLRRAASVGTR